MPRRSAAVVGHRRPHCTPGDALTTFPALGVIPQIVDALTQAGIVEAFPIQEYALPVALTGSDLIGQARTGTGKTLAFGIPLLQRIIAPDDRSYVDLVEPGKPQALVIVPTRELAIQVAGDLRAATTLRRVRILTVYGGRSYEPQVEGLRSGVEVVVGTPGRMLDLAQQGILDLSHVKVLVLDEADEMLDLGFLPDVERILSFTPEMRQTMLFSATMPSPVVSLARRYMRHPVNVRAEAPDAAVTVPTTAQFVYRAHSLDKDELVARLLQAEGRGLAMLFTKTKRQAQRVADELAERGFAAAAVHGDLGQGAREQALRAFRSGKVDVLVATDVAARGIDVDGVTHVVNYICPEDQKTYLHRIGRTGRAGASGVAVTLVDWDDVSRWKTINAGLGLPYDDPPEVYSTTESFYHDLGIPLGTTGVLPTVSRTRAGLDAEHLEDLGETGGGAAGRSRRGRTGPGDRPARASSTGRTGRPSGSDGSAGTGSQRADRGERPNRPSTRGRSDRSSDHPADAASTSAATGGSNTPAAAESALSLPAAGQEASDAGSARARTARPRRRTRRGQDQPTSADSPT